jgi:outer membrane protein
MKVNFVNLFIISTILLGASFARAEDILSKASAFDLMKKNGFKWKQTELILKQAEALSGQAQAMLNPHVLVYSREQGGRLSQLQLGFTDPGNLNYYTFGATVLEGTYSLYDKSAVERLNAAQVNEKSSSALRDQYQLDLTYVMLVQYLNCQRLKRKLDLTEINLKKSQELFGLAKAKVEAGVGIELDLKRAEGLLEFQNLRKTDGETALSKAKQDLATTLGLAQLTGELLPLNYGKIKFELSTKVPEDRPDLKFARFSTDLAEALKKQIEGEKSIRLEVFSDLGLVGTQIIGGVDQAVTGFVGIQATFPLFDGHFISSQIQESEVRISQSQLQLRQTHLEADAQLKISSDQIRDSEKAVDTSNRQVSISEEELKLAEKRFRSGISSGLELSSAQTSLAGANDGHLDALFGYELAKINYFKATGTFDEYLKSEGQTP